MRNKGLIITLIILLLIIIVLLIGFLVLVLNGNINFKGGVIHFGSKRSDKIIYNETYNLEEVKLIDVKQSAGDIVFENTDENNIKVEVYGENQSDVDVSLNNNELLIDYKGNDKRMVI